MRKALRPEVVLTIVCVVSALALALINNLTADRIAEQKHLAEVQAVSEALLQEGDVKCNPSRDISIVPEWKEKDGTVKKICVGRNSKNEIVGLAFTSVGEGYGGFITIMMGVDLSGKIIGVEVLEHLETPGLGARIESQEFKDQFRGKYREGSPEGNLMVVKGRKSEKNWEIEALTGATVSPRGVVQAINDGLKMFDKYKKEILAVEELKGEIR